MNPYTGEMSDTVKVEHVFTLKFSDKWDRPLRKLIDSGLSLAKEYAESFRFISIGITAYFVMSGTARLVEAFRGNRPSSSSSSSHTNHKSSSSSSSPLKDKSREKSSSKDKDKSAPRSPKSDKKKAAKSDGSLSTPAIASVPKIS